MDNETKREIDIRVHPECEKCKNCITESTDKKFVDRHYCDSDPDLCRRYNDTCIKDILREILPVRRIHYISSASGLQFDKFLFNPDYRSLIKYCSEDLKSEEINTDLKSKRVWFEIRSNIPIELGYTSKVVSKKFWSMAAANKEYEKIAYKEYSIYREHPCLYICLSMSQESDNGNIEDLTFSYCLKRRDYEI